jgi:hypothetical protein
MNHHADNARAIPNVVAKRERNNLMLPRRIAVHVSEIIHGTAKSVPFSLASNAHPQTRPIRIVVFQAKLSLNARTLNHMHNVPHNMIRLSLFIDPDMYRNIGFMTPIASIVATLVG